MTQNALAERLDAMVAVAMTSDAPLAERLALIAAEVRRLSPPFADAVDSFVSQLSAAEAGHDAPAIGAHFPSFALPDTSGRLVSSDELLRRGPLVVSFQRGHWCPYCRVTTHALGQMAEKTQQTTGANIVAITPETQRYSRELAVVSGGVPVLTDRDSSFASRIGLAIWVDDAMSSLIAGAGWDVPSFNANADWLLPIPAVFVIDQNSVVVDRHVNPDYRVRADLASILASLEKLN